MTMENTKVGEDIPSPHLDNKIVRRLDEFPELVQALRDGDLVTGRLFCAQLFDCDGRRNRVDEVPPNLQAAMERLEDYSTLHPSALLANHPLVWG
jgi:hypothetical protein